MWTVRGGCIDWPLVRACLLNRQVNGVEARALRRKGESYEKKDMGIGALHVLAWLRG
jgi:hypothetical protein